jgi:hypothetical protein
MNNAGRYVLGDIPVDLRIRGWELVPSQSTVFVAFAGPRYQAVFVRPFDPAVDDEALRLRRRGQDWVRISTGYRATSWEEARRQAIALMHAADARQPAAAENGEHPSQ